MFREVGSTNSTTEWKTIGKRHKPTGPPGVPPEGHLKLQTANPSVCQLLTPPDEKQEETGERERAEGKEASVPTR
jgi:hypothetical protein